MATLACFHAHPDDEAISTAGTMAKAVRNGHRVVLIVATRGEHGEVADGFLDTDETLAQRRVAETHEAAKVLGVDAVHFLGYVDSGMVDTSTNEAPESFWQADVDEAAERLGGILRDEAVDVLTVYDDHGGYGHPDHIQVHRVGLRAAEVAGVDQVLEATLNRDHLRRMIELAREASPEVAEEAPDVGDASEFGTPEELITTTVDVRDFVDLKRAAMRAHASQMDENHMLVAMPDEVFREVMGWEWFIRRGVPATHRDDDIFAGLI